MHAKTDSELTSLAPSSPDRHRRPVYFVQSPSRDSHDGEKTTTSLNSTPMLGSPMGSPPHSSAACHSRESSTSRFSGSLKPGLRKISSYDVGSGGRGRENGRLTNWEECDLMEEEGFCEDEESRNGLPPRCYFLAFFVGFFVVFSLFALILWGVSKPQRPKITMQSIKFERFMVQAGSDDSGVSTDMISLNSTVKFNYRNTASFFGVHVSSTPVSLSYSQLKIGSGDVQEFYKKRKQEENALVIVIGDQIPMYGSGASLTTPTGMTTLPVQLTLEFTVRSRAHVLGELVKQRFYNKVECSIVFTMKQMDVPISLKNCTYDR
ncbi:transmembrane protein [Perilla frutescens var. hirtella]|uniref:Transmembrane protein n=1 Tax=Perilla frutescens var. hirtella TaxID=608512 RepID=A0AAD4JEF5_PERFH|nr:transmembrane protein [Perilla frutescens var. hirtella]